MFNAFKQNWKEQPLISKISLFVSLGTLLAAVLLR